MLRRRPQRYKKGLNKQNNNFVCESRFFLHFFVVTAQRDNASHNVTIPIFESEGRKQATELAYGS